MLRFLFSNQRTDVGSPALFFDRDGVINCRRPDDYVLDWSQFVFVPGIREALKQFSSLGFPIIIISNQAAVNKGLLARDVLAGITTRLFETLGSDGTPLAAAYYCPHRTDEDCACRKPKPGLLLSAAQDLAVDLRRSVLIGDSHADMQAAQAAGCTPVLFGSGLAASSHPSGWVSGLPTAPTASELFDVVVNCLRADESTRANAHGSQSSGRASG